MLIDFYRYTISVRDILAWVNFINKCSTGVGCSVMPSCSELYLHGACLVFLDALGAGTCVLRPSVDISPNL